MEVTDLRVYPVKSCRGHSVTQAVVEPWGLAGDRRWMLVDTDGAAVTAREVPRLLLVEPTETGDGLRVQAPDADPLVVRRPDPARGLVPVSLWSSVLEATPVDSEADRWFSRVAGREVRLVWLDDPARRPTSPDFGKPDDRVSFADGYPLLLATEASLQALNDQVTETSGGYGEPLSMLRFRPNLILSGAAAWAEDDWRVLRVGGPDGAVFRAVKSCARCVMTTRDPDTAEGGAEPIRSLARIRRWDGATWFGINLVPDSAGVRVAVGDTVEVLDAVASGAGPVRPAK